MWNITNICNKIINLYKYFFKENNLKRVINFGEWTCGGEYIYS